MPISLSRSLVEYLLLGPTGDRRLLQDSPVLGDVWIAFANDPAAAQDLLITPHRDQPASEVAAELDTAVSLRRQTMKESVLANIASLRGVVVARLFFDEVLYDVVPKTGWYRRSRPSGASHVMEGGLRSAEALVSIAGRAALHWSDPGRTKRATDRVSSLDRFIILAGLIVWARRQSEEAVPSATRLATMISQAKDLAEIFQEMRGHLSDTSSRKNLVHQVALNRTATMAIARSVPAIKGDAARGLFSVNCENIAWAVLDSGIKGDHAAFADADGKPRVKAAYDFRNLHKIIRLDNLRIFGSKGNLAAQQRILKELLSPHLENPPDPSTAGAELLALAGEHKAGRLPNWSIVEKFIAIKIDTPVTVSDHGTHVAGILGAVKPSSKTAAKHNISKDELLDYVDGICPDIQLYDFRVLSDDEDSTEFAIIGALQFIDYLNSRTGQMAIHGANLSLSIRHDVKNYACGGTPVCRDCDRLVESGVVVVAAAGNFGHHSFMTANGAYEGYAAFSITDPGNAENVITVGSTHRDSPHSNGVSFFSSRGPTGDGRAKPDLVAPGERIFAPVREHWGELDGTSMAAPHVSGAAAMLLARYPELIGRPRRIKEILCKTATDLGRERSFQGFGMLDTLRALQSI